MAETKIEWATTSWNCVTGCSPVSDGCTRCYAARMAKRLQAMGQPRYRDGFAVRFHPEALEEPLHWRKPRRVFVCSMSDLFHEDVPDEQIAAVFGVIAACPAHQFMVLTKRAERMREWFDWTGWIGPPVPMASQRQKNERVNYNRLRTVWEGWRAGMPTEDWLPHVYGSWPLSNVWLGVTAENQEQADKRIPLLLDTPAAVRFVSVEPMLEGVDLERWFYCKHCRDDDYWGKGAVDDPLSSAMGGRPWRECCTGLDWVICGGESGPGARPMKPEWARNLRDQCVAAGVLFHFKQWGGVNKKKAGRVLQGRTWEQMPQM